MYVWQIIRAAGQVLAVASQTMSFYNFLLWVGPIDDVDMRTAAHTRVASITIVWFGLGGCWGEGWFGGV